MFKTTSNTIITILVFAALMVFGVTFLGGQKGKVDVAQNLVDITEVAAMSSFDYSSRVDTGLVKIDKVIFENKVKTEVNKIQAIKSSTKDITFDYATAGENTYAMRVKMVVGGAEYHATFAFDKKD